MVRLFTPVSEPPGTGHQWFGGGRCILRGCFVTPDPKRCFCPVQGSPLWFFCVSISASGLARFKWYLASTFRSLMASTRDPSICTPPPVVVLAGLYLLFNFSVLLLHHLHAGFVSARTDGWPYVWLGPCAASTHSASNKSLDILLNHVVFGDASGDFVGNI